MRISQVIKNEHGFTLVELMSSMAILALVSLVATSYLGSHESREARTTGRVNTQLVSARFVEQIRFDYEAGDDIGTLSIKPPDSFSTTDIIVNGESYPNDTAQVDVNYDQPLRISFVLSRPDGPDLPIQASWKPK